MTAIHLVLDGFLDELPVPGDDGLTARFRVISSPTDDATDETVFACRTADPHIAHALLTLMRPGDLLRVSGHLILPGPARATRAARGWTSTPWSSCPPRPPGTWPRWSSTATAPTS